MALSDKEKETMALQRLGLKLYAKKPWKGEIRGLIPVFHSWIQGQVVEDHLLIDVHDYTHIDRGPGVLLVAHEGNFSLDLEENRPGLLYYRKQPLEGSPSQCLETVVRTVLQAGARLEEESELEGIRFRSDEFLFLINDRLHAPNTAQTLHRFQPCLKPFLHRLLDGAPFTLSRRADRKERFAVKVKTRKSPRIQALLERLAAAASGI